MAITEERARRLAAGLLMIGFKGLEVPDEVGRLIGSGIRGIVLFRHNIGTRDDVVRLTEDLHRRNPETFVAIDHEGGAVDRLRGVATSWPAPMAVAAAGPPSLAEGVALAMGHDLRQLGIDLNFAPVLDVPQFVHNPVLGTRVFSDSPADVATYGAAVVRGYRRAGVLSVGKHFPGHGGTPVDSHLDLPRDDTPLPTLLSRDVVPFEAAILAGVDGLMLSHVWYSTLDTAPRPATVSPAVAGLARRHLGYDGALITDCMEMDALQNVLPTGEAAVQSVEAGCDLVIVSHRLDRQLEALAALSAAIRSGRLSEDRVRRSHERLSRLVPPSRAGNPPAISATDVIQSAVTVVRGAEHLPVSLEPGTRIGVMEVDGLGSPVEGEEHVSPLARAIGRRHPTVRDLQWSGEVPACLDQVDLMIVGSALLRPGSMEAGAIQRIAARVPTIVVGLRSPADVLALPDVPCFVAVYGAGEEQAEAATAVIFGERVASGRCPLHAVFPQP